MILSHIHGPQAWRKSGYWKWKIAQSLDLLSAGA